MKELHSESEDQDLEFTQDVTGSHIPDTEEVPVDTAKIQAALEQRADQETAVLPHLTVPDTDEPDTPAGNSGNFPVSELSQAEHEPRKSGKLAHKKRRTIRSLRERWWTPSVRSWFYTFMCMNIPIYGWFYLKKLARQPEHNKMQDFARAYLYYKMVFLAVSLVIVILLLIVGIIGINKLFAYMELL